MENKTNIAVIISNWNDEIQEKLLLGIEEKAKEYGAQVIVYTSQGADRGDVYDQGENKVYSLIDVSNYQGIIFAGITIMDQILRTQIKKTITDSGVPAISIEEQIDGFEFVGIDNAQAMRQMLEHIYVLESDKPYYFLSGKMNHSENLDRYQAFCQFVEEMNLEFKILIGDFTFESGCKAASQLIREGLKSGILICANDEMALGALKVFTEEGYRIPEDMVITGFDNIPESLKSRPGITTVNRPKKELGEYAIELLMKRLLTGIPESVTLKTQIITRDSTKNYYQTEQACNEIVNRELWNYYQMEKFNKSFDYLSNEMMQCRYIDELTALINKDMEVHTEDRIWIKVSQELEYFLTAHSIRVQRSIHVANNDIMEELFIFGGKASTEFVQMECKPTDSFCILPLHFKEKLHGYVTIASDEVGKSLPFYYRLARRISEAIEQMKSVELLNLMNEHFNQLSITDHLTGLLNRQGYEQYVKQYLKKIRDQKLIPAVGILDINRLKYINDEYGHIEGDKAIYYASACIKHNFPEDAVVVRYGGDEFLVVFSIQVEADIEAISKKINEDLVEIQKQMRLQFSLSLSKGFSIVTEQNDEELILNIQEADKKMYLNKYAERNIH